MRTATIKSVQSVSTGQRRVHKEKGKGLRQLQKKKIYTGEPGWSLVSPALSVVGCRFVTVYGYPVWLMKSNCEQNRTEKKKKVSGVYRRRSSGGGGDEDEGDSEEEGRKEEERREWKKKTLVHLFNTDVNSESANGTAEYSVDCESKDGWDGRDI